MYLQSTEYVKGSRQAERHNDGLKWNVEGEEWMDSKQERMKRKYR